MSSSAESPPSKVRFIFLFLFTCPLSCCQLLLFWFSDEKEKLTLQHQNELRAQKNESAKLKEELIQAGLRHETTLKEAIKAGKAEVEESKAALIELHEGEIQILQDRLCNEIDEERELREMERQRNNQLELVQIVHGKIIKDLDDKIRSKRLSFALYPFLSCRFVLIPASCSFCCRLILIPVSLVLFRIHLP
jgi:hypothetical protein